MGGPHFGCQNSMKRFKFCKSAGIYKDNSNNMCLLSGCMSASLQTSFDRCRRSFGEKHTLESPFVLSCLDIIVDMNHHENIVELTAETLKIAFLQMLLFPKQHP